MIRREFLASLGLFLIGCKEKLINPEVKARKIHQLLGSGFSLTTGQTTFAMTDNTTPAGIPGENLIPELYLRWYVPAKGNLSLLVFLNGWASGGDFLPMQSTQDYLTQHNIALVSIGRRGRNTLGPPNYGTDNSGHGSTLETYRDASGIECFDIYQTVQYFLNNIVSPGQINTDKIFGYGSSGGGGNVIATACKYPEFFSMVVDFFGMSKYGTYPGDPDFSWKGWGVDDLSYAGEISLAVGDRADGFPGYVAGQLGDMLYISRDHIRGIGNYRGKFHIYHQTQDGYVSITSSDKLDAQMTLNGQTHDFHRSTDPAIYIHGHADIFDADFDPVTPYGLHWVSDAQTLTRQTLANSGTLFVAGYVVTDNFELWMKRFRINGPAATAKGTNQGRMGAATLVYNVSSNTYQVTPIFPTSPLESYYFIYLKAGANTTEVQVANGDTITLSPKALNKKPASLNYTWTLFYDLSDSDGYILDDAGNVSNIIDLTGNNMIAWQHTRSSRKALSGGGLLNMIYYLKYTSGTLGTSGKSITLAGTFSLIVKVNANTVAFNQNILGRGISYLAIWPKSPYTHTQIAFQIGGTAFQTLNNSTNTEAGTGLMVIGIRRDSSNNIYIYSKSAAGLFIYGPGGVMGQSSNNFDFSGLGGIATTNQFDGTIYRVATSSDDIGATDMQTLLNSWYAS